MHAGPIGAITAGPDGAVSADGRVMGRLADGLIMIFVHCRTGEKALRLCQATRTSVDADSNAQASPSISAVKMLRRPVIQVLVSECRFL